MPKFSAGQRTTAGTATLPSISIFSETNTDIMVTEAGCFNTSSTAFEIRLARTAAGPGTAGAALTKNALDNPLATAKALAFGSHTAGAVTLTDAGYRAVVGPYGGVIFTFDQMEIPAAAGTVNGLVLVVEQGAGQISQSYFKWTE